MRTGLIFVGCLTGVALIVFLFWAQYYRAEEYQIVHTAFVVGTNQNLISSRSAICYSNEQLRRAVKETNVLERAGLTPYNLDQPNLIACIISNYVVEKVVGRANLGFILVHQSTTNGISFTVFKGTKRFLQFNYR